MGWSATFGYGYTDAKIKGDFTVIDRPDVAGNPPVLSAHDGDALPYVPKQTVTAGLGYTHPLTADLTLDLRGDLSYRSSVTTQINASAAGYQELGGFTTVGASAALHIGSAWRTRLYVNNLTNTQGISAAGPVLRNADTYAPNYRENYLTRPRTVGLSVEYRFR
jgi:outer membrane receptor protein involved in Fe transport